MLFTDELWAELCPFLPNYNLSPKGGRPRLDKRKIAVLSKLNRKLGIPQKN